MKFFRRLAGIHKILDPEKTDKDQESKLTHQLLNSQKDINTETQEGITQTKNMSPSIFFKQLWTLSSGIRRQLPYLFITMTVNSLITLMSIGLIIPFILFIQNKDYVNSSIDISHLSMIKQTIIEFSRFLYRILHLNSPNMLILVLGILFILLFIIRTLSSIYVEYKIVKYGLVINKHFTGKLLSALSYISYTYSLGRNKADTWYMFTLANQASSILTRIFSTINDVIFIVFLGIGVAIWSPMVIGFGVLLFLIIIFIYKLSHKELQLLSVFIHALRRGETNNLHQGLYNFIFSRLFHVEKFFINNYHNTVNQLHPIQSYNKVITSLPRLCIELLFVISFITYAILTIIISPESTEDIMTTAAFLAAAVIKLIPAALKLSEFLSAFADNQVIMHKFHREYTTAIKHTIDTTDYDTITPLPFNDSIAIKNISYAYPEFSKMGTELIYDQSPPVIKNISLSIKKGERVGIVGQSGGGKTTLMYLLMAFLEPSKGTIKVDGVNINTSMREWQKNIGYVSQENMLMKGTVIENIAFGIPAQDIDEAQVIKTLKTVQLWKFIQTLPQGIHTQIGDEGKRFSGGQKQRLGIARALYRNPTVIFFDEATSHLDQKTEKEIKKAIDRLDKNITIIIIAHRINTLENCDKIYQLVKGKIRFSGTYKQLLKIIEQ